MPDFELLPSWGNTIEITKDIPEQLAGGYRLKGATPWLARGDFGHLLAYHFVGDGFEFWLTNLKVERPVDLIGRSHLPALEVHIPFFNWFESDWEGAGHVALREKEYGLTHTPHVENRSRLRRGTFMTFDVHYALDYLKRFSDMHPALQRFIEQVEAGRPATLTMGPLELTAEMIALIRQVMAYNRAEEFAPLFYEGAAAMLLSLILGAVDPDAHHTIDTTAVVQSSSLSSSHDLYALDARGSASPADVPNASSARYLPSIGSGQRSRFTGHEIERTERVRELVEADLEHESTMKGLADKVGLNINTLQSCFQERYGCTVYQYSIRNRMLRAKFYLRHHPEKKVREIASIVGFRDHSNFTTAFKKAFAYTPEYYRSHPKLDD